MNASVPTPLVDAIRAFERDNGAPPQDLVELVPRYITAVPHTGMSAYPDYKYATGSVCESSDDDWQLVVETGDILNWDFFFYCPSKDYPKDIGGD